MQGEKIVNRQFEPVSVCTESLRAIRILPLQSNTLRRSGKTWKNHHLSADFVFASKRTGQ
jgi:hypothetical protein